MADIRRVTHVLEDFHDWGRPWDYIHAALAHEGLDTSEIQLINELWAEVTAAKYWVAASFQTADGIIRPQLSTLHPWLTKSAIDSLIRAASYEWK
jgi:hypothetical protein